MLKMPKIRDKKTMFHKVKQMVVVYLYLNSLIVSFAEDLSQSCASQSASQGKEIGSALPEFHENST